VFTPIISIITVSYKCFLPLLPCIGLDVCFSIPNPGNFSIENTGIIVGGTGTFAGATGSITGDFVGTGLQADDTGLKFQVFSVNSGLWTLTLDD